MEKINDIIESIANEKGLDFEDVKQKVLISFINTAKRLFGQDYEYEALYDENAKNIKLFKKAIVGEQITLDDAKKIDLEVENLDEIKFDINLNEFGRTASECLSKELNYHIQRLLEEKILKSWSNKVGSLIFGSVIHIDKDETTFIEIDDLKVFMPRKNRIKNENFKVGDIVRAVIKRVWVDKKQGIKIEVSRTSPRFLEAMLEIQVPEIKDKNVIIKSCSRIPGRKAKVSLLSINPNIDPIGACVGVKGVRIDAVSKELNGENIDVFEYSSSPEILVSRAISPAIANSVKIDEKKAKVYINSDQKSKAIGKEGMNIRLASMLSGYEIELIENSTSENQVVKDLKSLFGE
ncbi:transcription termination/antitermination protein NusA [Campylobacter sp. FMV-PI01]|uniref:Transcription termination/antitermination protein NusA n=1 Tax=Campylobacter portucalensis TaxID=2608384 RepID=A0A6L5WHF9_9BACT|nr:transcription termination factor NusA [Campylobacter portucalensis]MSN95637.1 transcription termination/antitermination protein NusA [Campylobacter portucalensis]